MCDDFDVAMILFSMKSNTSTLSTNTESSANTPHKGVVLAESSTNTTLEGVALLGKRVEIYWPREKQWYPAIINEYSVRLGCKNEPNYHILYDDGEDEWVHFNKNVRII